MPTSASEPIIEAVHHANVPGSGIAYWALLSGVVVTAFYSFRMYFLVFHGKPRFETAHGRAGRIPASSARHGPARIRRQPPSGITIMSDQANPNKEQPQKT